MTHRRLLALYPRWWRDRYGDEMLALLELAPARPRDRVDLARGVLDAWLHPPEPSRLPAIAALMGGGLWTAVAAGVVIQPVPPDWPGYLEETVPLAFLAVACLLFAVLGIATRAADAGGRALSLAVGLAIVGYVAWIVALSGTASGTVDGATLGAAQAAAMIATVAIGAVLVRAGVDRIGSLVIFASVAMLVPWAGMWLAFGGCWTAIGMVLIMDRSRWFGERRGMP